MLTRKKSVVSCFVIGALLCTLTSGGTMDVLAHGRSYTGMQDIRKTSLEENTGKIVTSAIKSTEDDSNDIVPMSAVVRIAGASAESGAADYGTTVKQAVVDAADAGVQIQSAEEVQTAEKIAPELENKVLTTVDTYQNIRLEPSEDAEIVGRLYEGSAGEVLENGDGWTKISSGGVEGWVHDEYVVSGEEAQDFAEESLDQVAVVTEEGVRVRAGASVDSTWIGVVNTDEVYTVVPEENTEETVSDPEWVRIVYDGETEGYVCADYVTTSFDLGEAKSMEEVRAEEEAEAKAQAEAEAKAQEEAEAAVSAQAETSDSAADSGWVALGEFKITAYCGGACCNGKWAGTTASGATPAEGRTIAVAPWIIPYGTQVMIEGMDGVYVAEDTGGFANRNPYQIDLFVADHSSAGSWGVRYRQVWVKY